MNWSDHRAAFERRLSTNYTATPVQYPGVPYAPGATSWIKMSLLPGAAQRKTLGPNAMFRETGLLLIMIFTPVGQGSDAARDIADLLFPIFREATFSYATSGVIRCRVPRLDDVGVTPDGTWYQANFTVDYERDLTLA